MLTKPGARSRTALVAPVVLTVALLAAACTSDDARSAGTTTTNETTTSSTTTVYRRADCALPDVARPVAATPVAGSTSDHDVTSFDGTTIRAHWFPVADATARAPRPTVLMGPGWGLAGDADPTADAVGILGAISIKSLNAAGYNVLTWDPRGFGRSTGVAQVDFAGAEGRDTQELIEWVSTLPGVQLDGPSDPRMGMVGGSYGGGIQFVTAAQDCRVDAIVPIIAWHSLQTSLFKNDTVKLGWAGLLTDGSKGASVDPVVTRSYAQGLANGTATDADRQWYLDRGPGDLVKRVKVPTLIVQGTVDTLFTLDEGVTNYALLRGTGVPVAMLWFCGGHGACYTNPGDTARVGRATLAWLDRFVQEDDSVELGPRIDVIDQDGVRHTAADLPEPSGSVTASGAGSLSLTKDSVSGPPTATPAKGDVVGGLATRIMPGRATDAVDVPVRFPDAPQLVLGSPSLTLRYSGTTPAGDRPTRAFAQLVDDSTGLVLGNQVTPVVLVLDGAEHRVTVPMEWVVFAAGKGASLTLQLVATTVAYSPPRLGGTVDFTAIDLSLPVVTGMDRRR
jgi:ABC-2 type transport system ATP-binding protein